MKLIVKHYTNFWTWFVFTLIKNYKENNYFFSILLNKINDIGHRKSHWGRSCRRSPSQPSRPSACKCHHYWKPQESSAPPERSHDASGQRNGTSARQACSRRTLRSRPRPASASERPCNENHHALRWRMPCLACFDYIMILLF